ncbi:Transposon Ty3-I Gag-Pol polyprotein [Dictyocoela muelleri]|nr:Transposon Ty3-I Gag-Pol polyprotein [Dictyocoela muelleri]
MMIMFGDLEYVKVFLDDVLIHSKSEEEHIDHLKTVMKILKQNQVAINFEKTIFFKKSITYLGHIIDCNGTKPDLSRLKPLTSIIPKTKRQLHRLLGIINWSRSYIQNLSQLYHH